VGACARWAAFYPSAPPFIEPRDQGLRYFWQALVAAYISTGAPRVVEPSGKADGDAPAWRVIIPRAVASLEDHHLKLVEVAREEEAFHGDAI
jgi:hypothetical protein